MNKQKPQNQNWLKFCGDKVSCIIFFFLLHLIGGSRHKDCLKSAY